MGLIILKFICLLLAVMYGFGNVGKVIHKMSISEWQMFFMSIGIVGFVFLQFKLYL